MSRIERHDLGQFGRGFLMGGADIIPGVSGGTVALILGIYERLVTAISHFDARFLTLLAERRVGEAARHVDLRFLVSLGLGILTGIACLAKLMRYLLLEQRMYTLAVFFGLILASSMIVARMIRADRSSERIRAILLAIVAGLFAFWLVGSTQVAFHDHAGYLFICGAVAICAMILPGISGAYVLWLLGAYEPVTRIIENLIHFKLTGREFMLLIVFACGCAAGLLGFSKFLRWLLARAHNATMAVLGGFMIGSLRGLWPFQHDLTPDVQQLKLKQYEAYVPDALDGDVALCLLLCLAAVAAVLLLEQFGGVTNSDDKKPIVANDQS